MSRVPSGLCGREGEGLPAELGRWEAQGYEGSMPTALQPSSVAAEREAGQGGRLRCLPNEGLGLAGEFLSASFRAGAV